MLNTQKWKMTAIITNYKALTGIYGNNKKQQKTNTNKFFKKRCVPYMVEASLKLSSERFHMAFPFSCTFRKSGLQVNSRITLKGFELGAQRQMVQCGLIYSV